MVSAIEKLGRAFGYPAEEHPDITFTIGLVGLFLWVGIDVILFPPEPARSVFLFSAVVGGIWFTLTPIIGQGGRPTHIIVSALLFGVSTLAVVYTIPASLQTSIQVLPLDFRAAMVAVVTSFLALMGTAFISLFVVGMKRYLEWRHPTEGIEDA